MMTPDRPRPRVFPTGVEPVTSTVKGWRSDLAEPREEGSALSTPSVWPKANDLTRGERGTTGHWSIVEAGLLSQS